MYWFQFFDSNWTEIDIFSGQMKITYTPLNLREFIENSAMALGVLFRWTYLSKLTHVILTHNRESGLGFGYRITKECPEIIYNDENRLRQVLHNLLTWVSNFKFEFWRGNLENSAKKNYQKKLISNTIIYLSVKNEDCNDIIIRNSKTPRNFDEISHRSRNAIKYTKRGRVTLEVEKKEGNLQIKIVDSGQGMTEKDLSQLNERLAQGGQAFLAVQGSIPDAGSFLDMMIAIGVVPKLYFCKHIFAALPQNKDKTIQLHWSCIKVYSLYIFCCRNCIRTYDFATQTYLCGCATKQRWKMGVVFMNAFYVATKPQESKHTRDISSNSIQKITAKVITLGSRSNLEFLLWLYGNVSVLAR